MTAVAEVLADSSDNSFADPIAAAEIAVKEERFVDAIRIYESLIEPAGPALAGLLHNLVPLYLKCRMPSAALRAAQAYTFFSPKSTEAWMQLGQLQERLGDWEAALGAVHRVLEIDPMHEGAHQSRLFILSSHAPQQDVRGYHESWASAMFPVVPPAKFDGVARKQLRIGYVSGDFRRHVMDRVIGPLLEYHNPQHFQIYCYDTVCRPDSITEKMRTNLVQWRECATLDDDAMCEMVRSDGCDILVDLSGITFGQRLGVFAKRPAPVQITWAGYLPTTGCSFFDWKLCDSTAGPQRDFTERLFRIPNALAMPPLPGAPPINDLPFHRNGYITFGCVNSYAKVTREAIDAWIEILRKIPDARLVMVVSGASEQETAIRVLRRFGPVQERVLLTEWATGSKFPTVFQDLDIALDTYPYGGCATSFDTLWQGTPIVCMEGDRPIGRYAAHFMKAVGLRDFICQDWEDYVHTAVSMAKMTRHLAIWREGMRDTIQNNPIFDTNRWVGIVEDAYRKMWNHYEQTRS